MWVFSILLKQSSVHKKKEFVNRLWTLRHKLHRLKKLIFKRQRKLNTDIFECFKCTFNITLNNITLNKFLLCFGFGWKYFLAAKASEHM